MRKIIFTLLVSISGLSLASAQFSGGNGTSGNPYLISSATDLASIAGTGYVNGGFYFRQTADINIAGYTNWTPIGTTTSQFNGFYDGNGKTISNLTITGTSTYRGLFGFTNTTAVIKNLSLTSVSVAGGNFTSALVGQNRGKLNNCSSQGNVTGRIPTGGLVAYNLNTGIVINCHSNCVVTGRNTVGGLIGQNEGTVSFSYATGSLSSNSVSYTTIGGFVASNAGNLSQCFATVNVSSSVIGVNGGAFVGVNTSSGVIANCYSNGTVIVDEDPGNEAVASGFVVTNSGEVSNSYSRGTVAGSEVAGFALFNSGTINNCFWDEGTFGAIGSDGGTATSTANMQTISTFTGAGWSFACEVWGINGSDNEEYPFLLWQDDYVLPASDCNYWTGASSTVWATSGNWSSGVPSSGSNILIRSTATNFPEVTTSVSLNITNVGENANLTISPTGTYTSTGQLINNGYIIINPVGKMTCSGSLVNNNGVEGLVLQSDASGSATLIHSTDNVPATVQRFVYGTQLFHVISTPVVGQSIKNFISENTGVIAYNPNPTASPGVPIYAMRHYTAGTGWSAYYIEANLGSLGNVVPGTAYTIGHAAPGTLTFKGMLVNTTQTKVLSGSGTGWNGIGNPFASALHVNNGINSFFQKYKEQLDADFRGLYVWDPVAKHYKIVNGVPLPILAQDYLATAQGFIVKSLPEGSTVYFETGMRAHQNPSFLKVEKDAGEWHGIILGIESLTGKKLTTVLAFNGDMTSDFDIDYDAGNYSENPNLKFYSRLPIAGNEINLGIQALPNQWGNPLVIPLGVLNTETGITIFSMASMALPNDVLVVLEDRELNTFTDLVAGNYVINLLTTTEITGRFYLHVGYNVTAEPINLLNDFSINVYPNPSTGNFNAEVNLKEASNLEFSLFDISGRMVTNIPQKQYSEGKNTIIVNTQNLLPGVYILKVRGYDALQRSLLFEKGLRVMIKGM
jgi:hypothetical protein